LSHLQNSKGASLDADKILEIENLSHFEAFVFRQFSLRGLRKVTGEWNLVCLAWNVKRMAVLSSKFG
jgi:hypothetical protein